MCVMAWGIWRRWGGGRCDDSLSEPERRLWPCTWWKEGSQPHRFLGRRCSVRSETAFVKTPEAPSGRLLCWVSKSDEEFDSIGWF